MLSFKTVLVVAPDFIPSTMPSSLRMKFLVQHLQEFGWKVIVLTVDPKFYERHQDSEMVRLLPPDLEVIRTAAWPVNLTKKFGFTNIGMRSLWHQWCELFRICKTRKVDMIFLSTPPNVPIILGRLINFFKPIPYIIDYQDPWVVDSYKKLPLRQRPPKWFWADLMARLLEPFALKKVSGISAVSQGTIDEVLSIYPSRKQGLPSEIIPLGVEISDFEYVRLHPRQNPFFQKEDGLLHICYLGTCNPFMHSVIKSLFKGFILGLKKNPKEFQRLRFHFVGTTYAINVTNQEQIIPIAKEMNIEEFVYEHPGRISYLDAIQTMMDAQGLMIIGSEAAHYTASKVFPYLCAKKILLTICHEKSTLCSIIQDVQGGQVVSFNQALELDQKIDTIYQALESMIAFSHRNELKTRWDIFESYTARSMSKRVAQFMDKILEKKKESNH